jgi:hypothetical protein
MYPASQVSLDESQMEVVMVILDSLLGDVAQNGTTAQNGRQLSNPNNSSHLSNAFNWFVGDLSLVPDEFTDAVATQEMLPADQDGVYLEVDGITSEMILVWLTEDFDRSDGLIGFLNQIQLRACLVIPFPESTSFSELRNTSWLLSFRVAVELPTIHIVDGVASLHSSGGSSGLSAPSKCHCVPCAFFYFCLDAPPSF